MPRYLEEKEVQALINNIPSGKVNIHYLLHRGLDDGSIDEVHMESILRLAQDCRTFEGWLEKVRLEGKSEVYFEFRMFVDALALFCERHQDTAQDEQTEFMGELHTVQALTDHVTKLSQALLSPDRKDLSPQTEFGIEQRKFFDDLEQFKMTYEQYERSITAHSIGSFIRQLRSLLESHPAFPMVMNLRTSKQHPQAGHAVSQTILHREDFLAWRQEMDPSKYAEFVQCMKVLKRLYDQIHEHGITQTDSLLETKTRVTHGVTTLVELGKTFAPPEAVTPSVSSTPDMELQELQKRLGFISGLLRDFETHINVQEFQDILKKIMVEIEKPSHFAPHLSRRFRIEPGVDEIRTPATKEALKLVPTEERETVLTVVRVAYRLLHYLDYARLSEQPEVYEGYVSRWQELKAGSREKVTPSQSRDILKEQFREGAYKFRQEKKIIAVLQLITNDIEQLSLDLETHRKDVPSEHATRLEKIIERASFVLRVEADRIQLDLLSKIGIPFKNYQILVQGVEDCREILKNHLKHLVVFILEQYPPTKGKDIFPDIEPEFEESQKIRSRSADLLRDVQDFKKKIDSANTKGDVEPRVLIQEIRNFEANVLLPFRVAVFPYLRYRDKHDFSTSFTRYREQADHLSTTDTIRLFSNQVVGSVEAYLGVFITNLNYRNDLLRHDSVMLQRTLKLLENLKGYLDTVKDLNNVACPEVLLQELKDVSMDLRGRLFNVQNNPLSQIVQSVTHLEERENVDEKLFHQLKRHIENATTLLKHMLESLSVV